MSRRRPFALPPALLIVCAALGATPARGGLVAVSRETRARPVVVSERANVADIDAPTCFANFTGSAPAAAGEHSTGNAGAGQASRLTSADTVSDGGSNGAGAAAAVTATPAAAIPLPPGAWGGAAVLIAIVGWQVVRRARSRTRSK